MCNFRCPCCNYKTLKEKPTDTFQICPVCYWEDDDVQFYDCNYEYGANDVSLNMARENFKKYHVSDIKFKDLVREPTDYEI